MKASPIACCFLLLPLLLSQAQGSSRKLAAMAATPSPSSAPKNEKINRGGNIPNSIFDAKITRSIRTVGKRGEKEASYRVKLGEQRGSDKSYPNVLDIAEMDYSPAKREPPIHN
ncbi:hypothetical protein MLD38_006790 [Melastoma candidum]|uniref:Uncharacterized protein n=1 Tax=Melastoma candidum TaxID=119954 RepID=A0ACB9RQW9_9MYRT|nr:hypothetical protein MLD38_006790 [Melastoma candidum]